MAIDAPRGSEILKTKERKMKKKNSILSWVEHKWRDHKDRSLRREEK